MRQLHDILRLLSARERLQLGAILLVMLPNAIFQVAGIASVMPFIAVLSQPELIESNAVLARVYSELGFERINDFLILLAAFSLIMLLVSNSLAALTSWLITRFTYRRVHSLSHRLLSLYLRREYAFFLARNPSELTRNVIQEVNGLVTGYLMPLLQLATRATVLLAILALLFWIDPLLAVVVGVLLSASYGFIYLYFKNRLTRLGEQRLIANQQRFQTTLEAFGAIKDLLVLNRADYYDARYASASWRFAVNQAAYSLIVELPRYLLETLAFGMILVIALYLVVSGQSMQSAMPLIALYAMAGYRLMPALQQIFTQVSMLRFSAPIVERIRGEMLARPVDARAFERKEGAGETLESRLPLVREIRLRGLRYGYPAMREEALRGIDLTIPACSTVALVGESGAGKSTLADVILGLLEPSAGEILIDDVPLNARNRVAWQRNIGYVPQAIYLADDTLRRNIALGLPGRHIDEARIEQAARAAAIHDFIVQELPDGYDTFAGDRGIRLSGGQRQRIGIARALYHDPDVLIFDEATSALDGSTEAAVMEAIGALSGRKTIILIAHRLATVRHCDRIFLLERGRLAGAGRFDELLQTSALFQRMACHVESSQ
ncbi:MAG: ATP-binding cassette domain-containing protein [Chromatiaceae bacterium]|nr:ATP-binding cassette domain-containing protein [Chromatiaceae bacterium]